jgi:hypothetical protein
MPTIDDAGLIGAVDSSSVYPLEDYASEQIEFQ